MLYRKIEKSILSWLKSDKICLLVEGARQVGKTTSIRKVLKENNIDFVEINLLNNKNYLSILDNIENMSCEQFYESMSIVSNHKLIKGKTVIFIDEVQACKDLVTKVKFLLEEGSYKYIFSGSLLGIELVNLKSAPVGFMHIEKMYPMDLEEFAISLNLPKKSFDLLRDSFEKKKPVDDWLHNTFMDVYKNYLVVGGMPKAVQTFVNTHNYNDVRKIQSQIIEMYKKDFTQYETMNKKMRLINTYKQIPIELNKQNKRFKISNIEKGLKYCRNEATFEWLNSAGVSIPIYNTTEPTYPLEINQKSNLFKLFLSDVGLLNSMYDKELIYKIIRDDNDVNFGALYENFIAQELNSHGYSGFYYNSRQYGEVDFLIQNLQKITPIEVKSGKSYTKHKALDHIMANEAFNIDYGIVFSKENLSEVNVAVEDKTSRDYKFKDLYTLYYMPIYMVMFIDKNNIEIPEAKLDTIEQAIDRLNNKNSKGE